MEERGKLLEDEMKKRDEKEQTMAELKKIRKKHKEELKDLKVEYTQACDRLVRYT